MSNQNQVVVRRTGIRASNRRNPNKANELNDSDILSALQGNIQLRTTARKQLLDILSASPLNQTSSHQENDLKALERSINDLKQQLQEQRPTANFSGYYMAFHKWSFNFTTGINSQQNYILKRLSFNAGAKLTFQQKFHIMRFQH